MPDEKERKGVIEDARGPRGAGRGNRHRNADGPSRDRVGVDTPPAGTRMPSSPEAPTPGDSRRRHG